MSDGTPTVQQALDELARLACVQAGTALIRAVEKHMPLLRSISEPAPNNAQWATTRPEPAAAALSAVATLSDDAACKRAADLLRAEVKRLEYPKAMVPQESDKIEHRQRGFEAAIMFLDPEHGISDRGMNQAMSDAAPAQSEAIGIHGLLGNYTPSATRRTAREEDLERVLRAVLYLDNGRWLGGLRDGADVTDVVGGLLDAVPPETIDIHVLLGNVIDHWEQVPNDIKSDPGMDNLNDAIRKASKALGGADEMSAGDKTSEAVLVVRHAPAGGTSRVALKTYDQGKECWEGAALDYLWVEPASDSCD
ncbi:MAG: hypothetical protein Q8R92_06075 [Deltaproteobacteria bacterium]|nr:hypothetical protein [Deltaproteobacteria bacterium]